MKTLSLRLVSAWLLAASGCASGGQADQGDAQAAGDTGAPEAAPVPPQPSSEAAPAATCEPRTCGAIGATCGVYSDGCGGTADCGPCAMPMPEKDASAPEAAPAPVVVDAGAPEVIDASDLGHPCSTSATPPYSCQGENEFCGGVSVYVLTCRESLPRFAACQDLVAITGSVCLGSTCADGACN